MLSLESNPTTGYVWEAIFDSAFLDLKKRILRHLMKNRSVLVEWRYSPSFRSRRERRRSLWSARGHGRAAPWRRDQFRSRSQNEIQSEGMALKAAE